MILLSLVCAALYVLGGALAWAFCMYHEERRAELGVPKPKHLRFMMSLAVILWPAFAVWMARPLGGAVEDR
jgi:hypothetical protein